MKKLVYLSLALSFLFACNNGTEHPGSGSDTTARRINTVKAISYSIQNSFVHDTSSFTQGLTFANGELYEGTGEYGRSKLMKVDLHSGKALKEISLDRQYFGEGIAILHDSIFQLTWKENTVFLYDLRSFKKLKEFPLSTEGWGITTDGKELIISDGSSNLYFYEPSTFKLLRTQGVYDNGELAFNLNELEYIDGFVYANQWQYPYILKIDPSNGKVVAKADMQVIWNRVKAEDPDADVPNGIAYDSTDKKIYITGKRWPKLFEVQFSN